ncbi:glutathione peroxidase [Roseomonas sp. CCTCC AB2023176]|uniref:glutathione peroxidase n=1 Tax=Roseomonas sp. CCTCC AB2023176 TaxID=3342640 RepID=UPI0035D5C0CF
MLDRRALLALPLMAPALARAADPNLADFTLTRLEGGEMRLAEFRGRVLLIVNTASFCGFTPQYAGLQRLQDRFASRGFAVIGVPSNDFNQESDDERRIKEFCEGIYSVEFPLAGLTHVRGRAAHPVFRWLASAGGGAPGWNFHKYLVARDGRRVTGFPTSVEPDAPALIRGIERALAEAAPAA